MSMIYGICECCNRGEGLPNGVRIFEDTKECILCTRLSSLETRWEEIAGIEKNEKQKGA